MNNDITITTLVQSGFAGFSALLLYMIYIYMKNIFKTLDRLISMNENQIAHHTRLLEELKSMLRKRPCLIKDD